MHTIILVHYLLRHVATLTCGALVLLAPARAGAQENFWEVVDKGRQLFEINEYELALKRIEYAKLLAKQADQRATAALYEGLLLWSLGRQHKVHAASAFRTGLLLAPKARLPTQASLQVESEFEEVRLRVRKELSSHAKPMVSGPHASAPQQQNFGSTLNEVQKLLESQEYALALQQLKRAHELIRHEEQRVAATLYEGVILASWGQQLLTRASSSLRDGLLRTPDAKLPVKAPTAAERHLEEVRVRVQKELASRPKAIPGDKSSWKPTGAMNKARESHTATLLPTGKVLVTGGVGSTGPLPDAELYEPSLGTWSPTDSMSTARFHHTATKLLSGNVLIVGGENDDQLALSSVEMYNPSTGVWTPAGTLKTGRRYHTATLLPSGKVLVTGGEDVSGDKLSSAELYDPDTNAWTPTGNMSIERIYHEAVLLQTDKVLVIGGTATSGNLSSSELYDPASGTWAPSGDLPTALYDHKAIKLPSGDVLVTGGHDGESALTTVAIYSPTSGTWTTSSKPMSTGHTGHTANLLSSGHVLVTGGEVGDSPFPVNTEVYHPFTDTWLPSSNMATDRSQHTATLLPSGNVLIAGGGNDGTLLSSAELYQP